MSDAPQESDLSPVPENPTTPLGAARPTFADEVSMRSNQFAADMLQLIPELEGVAIIPSYTIPQDRLPFGLIMGRAGPLRQPAEIMHMATQLHGCLKIQLDNAFQVIKNIDAYMGEQKNKLAQLEQQIHDAEQKLGFPDAPPTNNGGSTGEASSPGGGDPPGDPTSP